MVTLLQAEGIQVIAPANPLRGIANDATAINGVLGTIPGPILLVGHSYGGAVISNIPAETTNVVGLVYIAAFALDEGESGLDALGMFPPTLLGPALRPTTTDEEHPDLQIDPASFPEVFAADLPDDVTAALAVMQRPALGSAFGEPSGPPAWKRLPSWFLIPTADNVVGTEAERSFAERAGSVTIEIDASHAVTLSQPAAVTDLILTAISTIG